MAEHLTTVALLVVAALQLTVVEGSQPLLVLEFTADLVIIQTYNQ